MSVTKRLLGTAAAVAAIAVVLVGITAGGTSRFAPTTVFADSLKCDLAQYKASPGLTATVEQDVLTVSWSGQSGAELKARYAIDSGRPVIRELSVRKSGGPWAALGQNLTPEYFVKSGVRRMTTQQGEPLRDIGVNITPDVIEKNKWYAFWDSPFIVPGVPQPQPGRGEGGGRGRGQPGAQAGGRGDQA